MMVDSLLSAIERGRSGKEHGIGMGLPKLENVIDGVCKGVYTLITALSGVGKSSFMLYCYVYRPIMEHLDDDKFRISLFSLEMNSDKIMAKLLSTYIFEKYGRRLGLKQLLSVQKGYVLGDEDYKIVMECVPWMRKVERMFTIYDKSTSANSVYSNVLKELEARGEFKETERRKIYVPDDPEITHLVIIDHLSRIFPSNGRTLKEEMDLTSKYLYTLKNRCNISPVVIQQMNRGIQSIERRKAELATPQLSDLKDTNSTVEDAEIILALFSPYKMKLAKHRNYDVRKLGDRFRSVFVLKSRYGESDVEDALYYDGKCNKWVEMPDAGDISDYLAFDNPSWYLDERKDKGSSEPNKEKEFNFIL